MPKAQIPPGYAKVEALGTYGPATFANVFYADMSASDPTDPFGVMSLAHSALSDFYNGFKTQVVNGWTIVTFRVTYRADSTSIYTTTIADAIAGTATGGGQDAQVAFLINWTTGDARKGGKPRQYICGVPDSAVADSARISSGVVSTVNTDIATWLATFPRTSGTSHMEGIVEMSFVNGKVDRNPPIAMPILAGHMNNVVATQRRRIDRLR